KIDILEDQLCSNGQPLEPECTAITEEGIFYISSDTGMATKVVLYLADQSGGLHHPLPTILPVDAQIKPLEASRSQEYHILRCNTLRHLETRGWTGNYRIAQRTDGTFSCRIAERGTGRKRKDTMYREVNNQKLTICPNCFMKVSSLIDGVREAQRELF